MIPVPSPDPDITQIAGLHHVEAGVLVHAVEGMGALIANHQAVPATWRTAGFAKRRRDHDVSERPIDRAADGDEVGRLPSLKPVRAVTPGHERRIIEPAG